ncbi:DNA cytosine methyltransferase [Cedecea neteri]|uniref:DNA cytosine methyltransferase n=1 Tax=Cedecea neteri TaxID=158822 RepID=UPI00289F00DD|nr:DNA cytosine methyltransferase [Cedecea neteri]
MRYGSVCSGIEAATVAWESLGFTPAWFAQFDPEHNYKRGPDFPSAVLEKHYPLTPNIGDMTKIAQQVRAGDVEAPDIVVGGTPCQSYSIGGLRKGMNDPRGQLTLSYVDLADAIDRKREEQNKQAAIFVWENVPGVLSSKDNAFGCLLAGLAGEDCELQPPGGKWKNAGCVYGPQRAVAWVIKDSQYFGVAQRRPRVLLIASARRDADPAKILFEREGMRRDDTPTRQTALPVCLTARGAGSLDDRETYVVESGGRIRHLTPLENERQMGFPDNYTRISWKGRPEEECPDGPRYKAIGNSMAIPVMRWLGERINKILNGEDA